MKLLNNKNLSAAIEKRKTELEAKKSATSTPDTKGEKEGERK